jgi:DNA-binding XRE family transcriptional regulator
MWKSVKDFENIFMISSHGRLMSIRINGKILKQKISKTGYYIIVTRIGGRLGKAYCFKIHRLVANAFLDKPIDLDILNELNNVYGKIPVNHIDGNKLNNNYLNLEWCTYKHNSKHAFDNKLAISRIQETRKLTETDISYIREYSNKNGINQSDMARLFNIDRSAISRIINNKRYNKF